MAKYDTGIRLLTVAERDRLVDLIDIQNTATQVDRHESVELNRLFYKLMNDGHEIDELDS
jgi:hypothetical protein